MLSFLSGLGMGLELAGQAPGANLLETTVLALSLGLIWWSPAFHQEL